MSELSDAQLKYLRKLSGRKSMVGPPPEYQGDCLNLSGPELHALVSADLISRVPLHSPRDGESHKDRPPYIKITHRYFINDAGHAVLAAQDSRP